MLRIRGTAAAMLRKGHHGPTPAAPEVTASPVLATQARFATRVGFWRKSRNVRNPIYTRIRYPQMMHEDTRAQHHRYFMWCWVYELRHWRSKFKEMERHKVTEHEVMTMKIPKHKQGVTTVLKLLQHHTGRARYDLSELTFKNNPYVKAANTEHFDNERIVSAWQRSGRLHALVSEGKSVEEARRIIADRKAKWRQQKLQYAKEGSITKRAASYREMGVLSDSASEFEGKMADALKSGGGGGSGKGTRPRRATQYYEYDLDNNYLKILREPKLNIGRDLDPMTDMTPMETDQGSTFSVVGADYMTGGSSLPSDFSFPVQVAMR